VELGNSAFYEGQCHSYRRWQLACIAASRVLDWRDFITLPMPDAGDPSATAQFKRRLFDLFPHHIYEWHSVARFFCNHLCADAFEDWMRACVEQRKDLGPGQFPAPTCAGGAARAGEICRAQIKPLLFNSTIPGRDTRPATRRGYALPMPSAVCHKALRLPRRSRIEAAEGVHCGVSSPRRQGRRWWCRARKPRAETPISR